MVDVSQTGLCARLSNRAKLMKAPKRLLSCSARNILRARLAHVQVGDNTRLDLHTLLSKGSHLRLSVMHVLVEPVNVPDARDWIGTVMDAAYAGMSLLSAPGRRLTIQASSRFGGYCFSSIRPVARAKRERLSKISSSPCWKLRGVS